MPNVSTKTAILIAGLCLLMALTAKADPLNGQTVSRFIAAMEELQASESFFEHFMSAWESGIKDRDYPGSLMPSEMVAMMDGRDGQGTFEAVIEAHGFVSPEAWGRAGDQALLALMSLEIADNGPAMQQQLVQVRQEVDANPQFSDAQKQRMQQIIDSTSLLFDRVAEVSDADREAVRPHLDALKQALDYQSQY